MLRPAYKLFLVISFAGLFFINMSNVSAQGAPITGNAAVDLGLAASGELGLVTTIPINVDLTGVTATDAGSTTVPAVLGNYRIAISYDNTLVKARVSAGTVTGGTTAEFSAPASANMITSGSSDTLVIMYTQLSDTSPTGVINVANVDFDVLVATPTTVPLTLTVLDLRTPLIITGATPPVIGGEDIPTTETDGSINVVEATDADGDGMADAWEADNGVTDPAIDQEGDGLNNLDEFLNQTDPHNPDTDGDLVPDGAEVIAGNDPTDDTDFPLWIISAPVIEATELSPYQYSVIANDTGVTYSLDGFPAGMAIDAVTGVIDWTPAADETGDFNVTVRVDKAPETATQSFVITVFAKGDINADGAVNAADVLMAQRHVLGTLTLDPQQIQSADLYPPGGGDGQVTTSDLILIIRKALAF